MADPATLIEAIKQQEAATTLPAFSKEIAWRIGSMAHTAAVARRLAIGIEICAGGAPLFVSMLEGTSPNTSRWLRRKSNTVALFDSSTYALGLRLLWKQQTLARHALPEGDYAADGGGVPLRVASAGLVATLAISGLDQRGDHEFAMQVLCEHLGLKFGPLALPDDPA